MRDNKNLGLVSRIYNSVNFLNFGALFSDGTPQFVSPAEPQKGDKVTITFRTARTNVDEVYLVTREGRWHRMRLSHFNKIFDFYTVSIHDIQEPLNYYFEIFTE